MRALVCVLLAGLLGVAGCSTGDAPTSAGTASRFGGNDIAWIATTIAMDEQLLPLLDLVPQRSGSADVQAVALQVRAFTDAELTELYELYEQAGLPDVNPLKGTAMPGAVTAEQVSAAAKLSAKSFDAAALKAVRAHLERGRDLAAGEDRSGVEPQTRSAALQALRTREAALSALDSTS